MPSQTHSREAFAPLEHHFVLKVPHLNAPLCKCLSQLLLLQRQSHSENLYLCHHCPWHTQENKSNNQSDQNVCYEVLVDKSSCPARHIKITSGMILLHLAHAGTAALSFVSFQRSCKPTSGTCLVILAFKRSSRLHVSVLERTETSTFVPLAMNLRHSAMPSCRCTCVRPILNPPRPRSGAGWHCFDRAAANRPESCSNPRRGTLGNRALAGAWLARKTGGRRGSSGRTLGCGMVF